MSFATFQLFLSLTMSFFSLFDNDTHLLETKLAVPKSPY